MVTVADFILGGSRITADGDCSQEIKRCLLLGRKAIINLLLLLLLSLFVVSNSVWPHRQQPTRLPSPWDSPGKNTGVGCHFRLHCVKVKNESEVAQSPLTGSDPMDCSLPGSSHPWDFLDKSTGVACYCVLRKSTVVSYKSDNSDLTAN